MPEYIERDYAVYLVEHFGSMLTWSKEDILSEIKRKLKEQPTADVVEVRHSEWKQVTFSDGTKSCKCCMACGTFVEPKYNYKYCPECGAKMDGKEVDYA